MISFSEKKKLKILYFIDFQFRKNFYFLARKKLVEKKKFKVKQGMLNKY